jgi:hypothetical protein
MFEQGISRPCGYPLDQNEIENDCRLNVYSFNFNFRFLLRGAIWEEGGWNNTA